MSGEGYRARLKRIPGETPSNVLPRALYLPCLLGTIAQSEEASHSEYETVGAGEFSQPAYGGQAARRLRTFDDLQTLTVEWNPQWMVEEGVSYDYVRETLFFILRSKRPVELLIAPRTVVGNAVVHMFVTLRRVSPEVREGQPDSVYLALGVKEWRAHEQRRRAASGKRETPVTHTLTEKDTLLSLARLYYDDPSFWRKIASLNGVKKWGQSDPLVGMQRYKVGDKIKLPTPTEGWESMSDLGGPVKRGPDQVNTGRFDGVFR
jgi:nucleoid-associated protein YgaU